MRGLALIAAVSMLSPLGALAQTAANFGFSPGTGMRSRISGGATSGSSGFYGNYGSGVGVSGAGVTQNGTPGSLPGTNNSP